LEDYFRVPSVRHYLIVKTENQVVIHHQRGISAARRAASPRAYSVMAPCGSIRPAWR
jgi:hypothetical protein